MTNKRNFTCIIGKNEKGTYTGSSPSSAARKVVSKMCREKNYKGVVTFSLREITQGSKKKIYGPYKGNMQKLIKPIELEGRVIKYKPIVKIVKQMGGQNDNDNKANNEIRIKCTNGNSDLPSVDISKKSLLNKFRQVNIGDQDYELPGSLECVIEGQNVTCRKIISNNNANNSSQVVANIKSSNNLGDLIKIYRSNISKDANIDVVIVI